MTSSRSARRHSCAIAPYFRSVEVFIGKGPPCASSRGPVRPEAVPQHQGAGGAGGERHDADLPPVARAARGQEEEQDREAEGGAERADDAQLAAVVALADLGREVDRPVAPREVLALA